jgi:tetratricopeptide (TPR) repeat protein
VFRLKLMRGCFFRVASVAAVLITGGYALAQAPEEGAVPPDSDADEIPGDDVPIPPPPRPFSRFDLEKLWAAPGEKKSNEDLEQGERKGTGPSTMTGKPAARGAVEKPGVAQAGRLKEALAPKPPPEAVRKQMLDVLFERLRKAGYPEDAQRIATSIQRIWLQSHSDTANLLMQRATASVQAGQFPLALSLYDKLVGLEPGWAEAWNQRAVTRFLTGDTDGAMADIGQVMKLEPRHFGALAGMGMILQGAGLDKGALEIFNKVLGIYPLDPDVQKLVEKLTLEVEGRDI